MCRLRRIAAAIELSPGRRRPRHMGFRKQGSIAAAALVVLALPSTAAADDYCVNRAGCAPARTFDATGLQAAFEAARNHVNSGGDPDRVLIGSGQYVAPGT